MRNLTEKKKVLVIVNQPNLAETNIKIQLLPATVCDTAPGKIGMAPIKIKVLKSVDHFVFSSMSLFTESIVIQKSLFKRFGKLTQVYHEQ